MTGTSTALPARHLVGRYTWDIREHEDTDRASLYVGAAPVPEDGTGGAK